MIRLRTVLGVEDNQVFAVFSNLASGRIVVFHEKTNVGIFADGVKFVSALEDWNPEDFFTDPAAFEQYKKRLRYIVARWGAHPNLLASSQSEKSTWSAATTTSREIPRNPPG